VNNNLSSFEKYDFQDGGQKLQSVENAWKPKKCKNRLIKLSNLSLFLIIK
jgi:hypothetical protein